MKVVAAIALAAVVTHDSGRPHRLAAPREVEIVGLDYVFKAPTEIAAGATTFRFRNTGKVRHELVLMRLKKGTSVDEVARLLKDDQPLAPVLDGRVGVLFADTGKRSTSGLTTVLSSGEQYVLLCGLTDTPNAPPHYEMGMYAMLRVRASKAPSAPITGKADTIIATDYAFIYPRTLPPGHHTLVFKNRGRVGHEMNIALLKRGVTLAQFLEVRKANRNARALVDEGLGVLLSQKGEEPLGRLDVELLPGREYRLVCFFTDTPTSREHFTMGMYGSIKTTGKAGN